MLKMAGQFLSAALLGMGLPTWAMSAEILPYFPALLLAFAILNFSIFNYFWLILCILFMGVIYVAFLIILNLIADARQRLNWVKTMNNRINILCITTIFICGVVTLTAAYLTRDVIEGDPTIYLSFAKIFFEKPFSFGVVENVSFGATSPVFLAILSFIYSYFGIEHLLSIAKLVNLTFYFTALIFCKKIIFLF